MTSSFYESGSYEEAEVLVLSRLRDGTFQKMYVEAWEGVGATALLREVAEEVESKNESIFDTVIKVVQPAPFQNPREIQRAVAKQVNLLQLNLPPSVTNILDAADEDDDFSYLVELSSRGLLSKVAEKINQAVKDRKVLLVFCNNITNDKLIDPNDLGIPIGKWIPNAVLWTSGMNISKEAASASADYRLKIFTRSKAAALDLVYKEAGEIASYIEESSGGSLRTTPQLVFRCFWYCLLLCRAFNRSELLDDDRPSEAVVKYFVCEGILQGDAAWEIGRALAPLIGPIIKYKQLKYWNEPFFNLEQVEKIELLPPKTLIIGEKEEGQRWEDLSSQEESYRWISVRSPQNNNPESWDFSKVYGRSDMSRVSSFGHFEKTHQVDLPDMSKVSSFFGHFEKTQEVDLPDGFFDRFSNIRVLDLLGCIVSPINSSFLRLRNLRMLRLEQCSVDPSSLSSAQEEKREQQQAIFFDSLWVLNLYNSDADKFLLAGKAFELMPNLLELDLEEKTSVLHLAAPNELGEHIHKLEVVKLSGNINTEFLAMSLSMEINLKELILTDCKGLQYLNFNLPATIETISLQSCASLEEVELAAPPLPNLKSFHLSDSKLIAKLSLQGCRKLENVDLQELTGLKVLNLSCTAIKVVDITKLPQLKQLLLLGCVLLHQVVGLDKEPGLDVLYLDNYNNSSACDVDHCLDSFRNQSLPDLTKGTFSQKKKKTKGTNDADQRLFQAHVVGRDFRIFRSLHKGPKLDNYYSSSAWDVDHGLDSFRNQSLRDLTKGTNDADQRLFRAHVVVRDVRLFRSLHNAFHGLRKVKTFFHIHIKGSSPIDQRGFNIGTITKSNATITSALCYADVLNTMTDRHRRHQPSPPTMPLNKHIEVDGGDNSRIVEDYRFRDIMGLANSLFVHDSTSNFTEVVYLTDLKCLRIERCPDLEFFFHPWTVGFLESIWLSQLPRLKALHKGMIRTVQLKHIYLEFCARLEYVLTSLSELQNLETINIRYCNDLTTIFKFDDDNEDKRGAAPMELSKLRSIHLQELPKLQHICKQNIRAPSLEELKIRGCFNLRKLPLFGTSDTSDADSMRAVEISCEKDWWDKLQWDGLESNHHASLFNPKHCPYYKKPMKARWL